MNSSEVSEKRAQTQDEIKPLVELCKAGKLFEVQEWVRDGKPINLPLEHEKRTKRNRPLWVAIELGFHSLVRVLLESGAEIEERDYSPLDHALWKRRLDLIQLLVEHGADIHSVTMASVFETWDTRIMEYFIEKGADVETGNPMAHALCSRIRTALSIFQRYKDRVPSFQKQINIALRHHCKEGNMKWVSLLLWAGADPYEKGPDSAYDDSYPGEDLNALELAALFEHPEIFKLKRIQLDPKQPRAKGLLRQVCHGGKADLLRGLLAKGFNPQEFEGEGSPLIQSLLNNLCWSFDYNFYDFYSSGRRPRKDIDTSKSREKIKMIHLLVRHGAKWKPRDESDVSNARKSLLKMSPDYTMEFIWIMSQYKACNRENIKELIRTPSILALLSKHAQRINEMVASCEVL